MYNKQKLAKEVQISLGCSFNKAEGIVDHVLSTIKTEVVKGRRVVLAGFGIFTTKKMKAKTGRNPRTGVVVKVPPYVKVKFTTAKKFKDYVNNQR